MMLRCLGGSMRNWRLVSICLVMAAACGGGGGGGSTTGPTNTNPGGTTNPGGGVTNTVNLADQAFNPGTVTVPTGTTVTWNWPSTLSLIHISEPTRQAEISYA